MPTLRERFESLASHLPADLARKRVDKALEDHERFRRALELIASGRSRSSALREAFPGRTGLGNLLTRLKRFEAEGVEALIQTRLPPSSPEAIGREHRDYLQKRCQVDLMVSASQLRGELAALGCEASETTIKRVRRELGLARPAGRRPGSQVSQGSRKGTRGGKVERMELAGSLFLLAAEAETGGVRALTEACTQHLRSLPTPEQPVRDDREHRSDKGQFTAAYNKARAGAEGPSGTKNPGVQTARQGKDLQGMRTTSTQAASRFKKDLALTLLPLVVSTARWSSLRGWKGGHLGSLVGTAYQPSTLDKYARELKYAGTSTAIRDAVTSHWMKQEPAGDGAVLVYVDGSTKPLWTRAFARSTKVSQTGRVMPANTTLMLNLGSGTPVLYRNYSGGAALSRQVPKMLEEIDEATGGGQVRRMVVVDREGHSVRMFKALRDAQWDFVTPLRRQVTGPHARFEDLTPWKPMASTSDECCEGKLHLNDSRKGQPPLTVRVVGRRRACGKVMWLATLAEAALYDAESLLKVYFDRWPLQELVFRDGKGRVGLDVHHGYGKTLTDHYAVLDSLDRLHAQIDKAQSKLLVLDRQQAALEADIQTSEDARRLLEETIQECRKALNALPPGSTLEQAQELVEEIGFSQERHHEHLGWEAQWNQQLRQVRRQRESLDDQRSRKQAEQERLHQRRKIYTVDVELDEIVLGYKLTFMNLSRWVMSQYLGASMQMDTLVETILTLPGERELTADEEIIRIDHQERDPATMKLVRRACQRVTERNLLRDGKRRLRMEVSSPRSASGDRLR